jgi:uncharacterized membrane protein YgcG
MVKDRVERHRRESALKPDLPRSTGDKKLGVSCRDAWRYPQHFGDDFVEQAARAKPGGIDLAVRYDDYRRAATINQRFANLTTGLVQAENWIGQTNQAVYRVTVPGGSRFVRVDAEQWTKQPAFDHAAVARSLSTAAGQPYTESTLPFLSISVVDNGTAFEGDASGSRYRCVIATSSCSRVGAAATAGGGRGGGGGGGSSSGGVSRGGSPRRGGGGHRGG